MTFNSLADIRQKLSELPTADMEATDKALARDAVLTKPAGSLGKLEEIAVWASAWQRQHPPVFNAPQIAVFAGNHGVCAKGVSAFPPEVTVQMVANFEAGGAAINQLANQYSASFSVTPLDLENPTKDFTESPAMSEYEFTSAFNTGWEEVDPNADFLIVGEMGIGNTTVAATLCAALLEGNGDEWAGPGTGISQEGVNHKAIVIDQAIAKHSNILEDPLRVFQHLGGRELSAMAGAVLAARFKNIPVILDGYVACAAMLPLFAENDQFLDHCIIGHASAEPGHVKLLNKFGKSPVLSLEMRLGEGSGAAVALGIVQSAILTHAGMASFGEAGVSDKN